MMVIKKFTMIITHNHDIRDLQIPSQLRQFDHYKVSNYISVRRGAYMTHNAYLKLPTRSEPFPRKPRSTDSNFQSKGNKIISSFQNNEYALDYCCDVISVLHSLHINTLHTSHH